MPLERKALESVVAQVNAGRRSGQEAILEEYRPEGFTLSFFDTPLPEGQCIDEHFVEIQFALNAAAKVDTGIVGARFDEERRRFVVEYEVVEWD